MIKLKEALNTVPKYLYHATYRPVLPSIKKYGLDSAKGKLA